MSRTSVCPGRAILERLLAGSLAVHEQRAVEKHCNRCDACQVALHELTYDEEGNPRPISCPRLAVLKGWLYGTISPYACEAVEHHLSTCKACEADFNAISWGFERVPRPIACPDLVVLKRLLDGSGSLPGHEQEAIEHHLETCDACQARLDSTASGGLNLQGEMRNLRQGSAPESPSLKRVIGVLKEEIEPETEATSSMALTPSEILGFLDPSDTPGDLGKLGPYRVQEVLGKGGMGIVLKAFDPTLLRAVAIKMLAPQLATSSSARQRFAREARAAAAIRNEHVVAIHSVDEWKGLPYLVMEFIPGSSLQARIDRSAPLDLNSILRIGMQVAKGLAAAHAQGLVHRDIKPANILLENCVERVKLTDFGLARAVDDASLTQSGVVTGTPLFMAPEQARSESVDHRADLFSLGVVIYAMCTGRSPFRASTTLGVLKRVCDETHRPVREVNSDVPDWLAQIIDRLLSKDRAERYQTANEVVDVLETQLANCQRGNGQSLERGPAPVRQTAAAVDDVGPAKGRHTIDDLKDWLESQAADDVGLAKAHLRHRRWLEIVGSLIVALAGLFVITEVIGVTNVVNSIAKVLGLKKQKGLIVIHLSNPELRVLLNDKVLDPGRVTNILSKTLTGYSIGYAVEVFKGDEKIAHEFFNLKPGMMVELRVLNDGKILYEYDGPIRPAPGDRIGTPSRPLKPSPPVPPSPPIPTADLSQERIYEEFKRDPEVVSLLNQIQSTTDELDRIKRLTRNAADPARVAPQRRLTKLHESCNELWKTKSEEIRRRLLGEQNLLDLNAP
jgi:serine/threonine protein kinase